mmetsp:Transcript_38073/g.91840  ORF Transcript_38073/g.91840 Transcript_38073/m.91840 type:complete len:95 (+) Transcript_38073:413-697(+)
MIVDLMIQVDVVARRIMGGWTGEKNRQKDDADGIRLTSWYMITSAPLPPLSSGNNAVHCMSMRGCYDIMEKEWDAVRVGCVGRYWLEESNCMKR